MSAPPPAHGFTAVDAQPRPADWVAVLDRLAAEPFYADYKRRLAELVDARPGERYLDAGAGTGQAAADCPGWTVAVDSSWTMAATGRSRGLPVAVADAHALPFARGVFAGVWADRVVQHLAEPDRALDELVRVLRPGGRLVLADPDYGTQELDIGDDALARPVLAYRAERALRHGTLAHRHAELLAARGLDAVAVERRTAVVRDPTAMDRVWGLRDWAYAAVEFGYLSGVEADAFVTAFDTAVHTGRFHYTVTFFLTAGRVPG